MRTLYAAAAVCLMGLMSLPAMAQSKMVAVDFQRAVLESAEFKKAADALQAKYKVKQDELAKASQELQDLETQIRNSGNDLSRAGLAELQARHTRKQTQVDRLTEDLQEQFEAERDAAVRLISGRMGDVLKKYAEDNQIDLIVDTQAARFVRPALDVTDKIITAYDAAHPVK